MPRRPRGGCGDIVFHVFNRGIRGCPLFDSAADYAAFHEVLVEAGQRIPMRLLSYATMPTHVHLVVWPIGDSDLSRYMHWLTATHARRWQLAHGTEGTGAVYQSRFKAIPVQQDNHFLRLCCYVERNPARAGHVAMAESWPWTSAAQRCRQSFGPTLHEWPVPRPDDWTNWLNRVESHRLLRVIRLSTDAGVGFGTHRWRAEIQARLGRYGRRRRAGRPRRNDCH
jgi:putative transposase